MIVGTITSREFLMGRVPAALKKFQFKKGGKKAAPKKKGGKKKK